ncbi:lytic polysaccharide monooxygenase auxiliary activity family 9 protein [Streptomyces sp. NRRL S-350]|uniref:lytic polysaccharide monooxygenase auxiliary activity family 9 protein n=1 Tax=Streptomyces sp. NRRL S-350 TaxID=1463902 RepID=UPI0004C0C02F|nr:lytic polysaccharide monooxygenase [Streptomyces sp. NRRL S-350]
MSIKRSALSAGAVGAAVLAVAAATAGTAVAHGTMTNPVSRVGACYAEGPEHPVSQVCKDLVATSGTQPLYDWNEVNIADANGNSQALIPDGRLCSANRDKYAALDWPRLDWPATPVKAGAFTFRFRTTAPHVGTQTVYITKPGYDPAKPLKWSDLDPAPVAQVQVDRTATNGYYTYSGTLPQRTGRQLLYTVWQRSDSPEAFYSCSDVDFGAAVAAGTAAVPALAAQTPAAPSDAQIAADAPKSTVAHHGHGGDPNAPAGQIVPTASAAVAGTSATGPLLLAGAAAIGVGWAGAVLRRRRVEAVRRDS